MAAHREANHSEIRFVLGGETVTLLDVSPTQTVLGYLRETRGRVGTKEGCAEGDCGACTVVVGELCGGQVSLKPVNACIQFVPTLDGRALVTVEDLRAPNGGLHPVQQAMVDCHGSQCGFCTPGFVMSLWSLYLNAMAVGARPDETEIRAALTGNLCRCTGYRPIIAAGQAMFDLPAAQFDRAALAKKLTSLRRQSSLAISYREQQFFSPKTLPELLRLRAAYPRATLLAGATDVGLWVNKQLRTLNEIIYIGEVAELKSIERTATALTMGAGVTLSQAFEALKPIYPEMNEMWARFASLPIRNAGTLGGNIANGSPIGDSMPALLAVDAKVVLTNLDGSRTLGLDALYLGYMQNVIAVDEVLTAIEIPLPSANGRFRTYKVSKRFDSDISAVCAAFQLALEGDTITSARVAFGGMAALPKRGAVTEAALTGARWNEATARLAMAALASDFAPLSDMRASSAYRLSTAKNLLYRFYLETNPAAALSAAEVSVFA